MKLLPLTLSSILILSSIQALGAGEACALPFTETKNVAFSQVDSSKNLSQLIRSNSVHFWSYASSSKNAQELRPYAKYEGIVAGDPHLGNFSVVPVLLKNGSRSMRFVNIDFDDAGRGSYAFDFARLVITVKAFDKDVKVKDLLDAYLAGLRGEDVEAPAVVNYAMSLRMADYDKYESDYVDKKTKGDGFKFKKDELESYSGKYSRKQIQQLFPDVTVLDLASRPKDRGGSAGAERIWVLTEDSNGVRRIAELKEYAPSAMSKYESQEKPEALVASVESVFRAGYSGEDYKLVTLGSKRFWLRGKKVSLFDVPYDLKSSEDQEFVESFSAFVANYLGKMHGSQSGSAAYLKAISKDEDAFREAIKAVMHEYLDLAQATLEE